MGELIILTKVTWFASALIKAGYAVAGGYLIRTGMIYVSDYKESVQQEKEALQQEQEG